jgi:predicted 3-demethylubiquinone-9 3-methyltransferase (glyoxalase superfamily)
MMQRITPNLWFDTRAEEAANFYVSIFPNSKITGISHYGETGAKGSGMKKGSVMTVVFELDSQQMMALNGGPAFKFNEAVSLVVNCMTQDEIDHYWDSLTQDGDPKAQICGWLKDKYGVSWQVVPVALGEMMEDEDITKTDRVMAALLKMKKLNIAKLKKAYLGK